MGCLDSVAVPVAFFLHLSVVSQSSASTSDTASGSTHLHCHLRAVYTSPGLHRSYTDLGANGFVLLAYALALRRRLWLSALAGTLSVGLVCPVSVPFAVNECGAGAVAVGFRQTNIVWCAFICCTAMARMVDESAVAPETRSHAPTAALLR